MITLKLYFEIKCIFKNVFVIIKKTIDTNKFIFYFIKTEPKHLNFFINKHLNHNFINIQITCYSMTVITDFLLM